MGWSEARRLSRIAYREMAFQAIYALRQGNVLPPAAAVGLERTTARRVLQSKIVVGVLLAFMGLGAGVALTPMAEHLLGPTAPEPIYRLAVVTAVMLLQLSLLWTTGLQILPTMLTSRILQLLETLPVSGPDLDRTGLLLFLRLFDVPALAILVVTPLAIGLGIGSPLAGLAALPGAVAVVLIALGLSLATGEFFVRRVKGSPTGAASTALRWGFLALWAVPAFAIYGFVSFSPAFLRSVTTLSILDPPQMTALLLVFPFPFAALPSLADPASLGALDLTHGSVVLLLAVLAAYAAMLALLADWLRGAPRRMALGIPEAGAVPAGAASPLRTTGPVRALMLKDLRMASRTTGYAFIVLLPVLDATVLGLATFVGNPTSSSVFRLGAAAVASAALLATFFGPAFFATEVMGFSYTQTLPLPARTLLLGKVGLVVVTYLLSAAIVLAFTASRVFSPLVFAAFAGAELPGLAAAALLEMGLLYRVSAKRGLAVTNLYTGAWWATVVVVPGLFLAGFPLAVFSALGGGDSALAAMALVALGELALALPLSERWARRSRR